jgi:hypothetical protein
MNNSDTAVLAYVVVDPTAWYEHVQEVFGDRAEEVLRMKVDRWRAEYEVESAKPGYLPRRYREETTGHG